jgi:inosose dehydratase
MTLRIAAHDYNWLPYSSGKEAEWPLERILEEVAAAGYTAVEFSDTPRERQDPAKTARLMEKFKLKLTGMSCLYRGEPDAETIMQEKARFIRDMGGDMVVLFDAARWSGPKPPVTDDLLKRLAEVSDRMTDYARSIGLDASMHNHLNTAVETPAQIDRFFECSERCGFCIDTGHLIAAGGDPVATVRKYGRRIRHSHFKDGRFKPDGKFDDFVELGTGNSRWKMDDVLAELKAVGYDGWLVLEQDRTKRTPLESARMNRDFMVGHGIGK